MSDDNHTIIVITSINNIFLVSKIKNRSFLIFFSIVVVVIGGTFQS